jgi:DNA-binding NarL/FixJ family response regulator
VENRIRVAIADDHTLLREGLIQLLQREKDLDMVGEGSSEQDVLDIVQKTSVDVLLLDLVMPGTDSLRILPLIRQKAPATKVLILADNFDQRLIFPVLQQGAKGFILKTVPSAELWKAIRMVHAGEVWIGRGVVRYLLENFVSVSTKHRSRRKEQGGLLSQREMEVARLVAGGCSNRDIANRLSISEKTVKTHLANIFKKLQLRNRLDLALHTRQWDPWMNDDDRGYQPVIHFGGIKSSKNIQLLE